MQPPAAFYAADTMIWRADCSAWLLTTWAVNASTISNRWHCTWGAIAPCCCSFNCSCVASCCLACPCSWPHLAPGHYLQQGGSAQGAARCMQGPLAQLLVAARAGAVMAGKAGPAGIGGDLFQADRALSRCALILGRGREHRQPSQGCQYQRSTPYIEIMVNQLWNKLASATGSV